MYAYHDEVNKKISARMTGFDSKGVAIQVNNINDITSTSIFPYIDFNCKSGAITTVVKTGTVNDLNVIACAYIQHDNQMGQMIIGSSNTKITKFKRFYNYQFKSVKYLGSYAVAEAINTKSLGKHLFVYKANNTLAKIDNTELEAIYLYGSVQNLQNYNYTVTPDYFFLTDHLYQAGYPAQKITFPKFPSEKLFLVNQSIVLFSPSMSSETSFIKAYPVGMLKIKFETTDYKSLADFSLISIGPEGVIADWKLTYLYMEKGKLSTMWLIILGIVTGLGFLVVLLIKCSSKNTDAYDIKDGLELQWDQDEKIIDM